jgi:predicted MFS family arabinose efflux permease
MGDHFKTVVAGDVKPDPAEELRKKRTAGSLTYSKAGLVSLFGWLLWGGVCFQLMEAVLVSLLPLQLRSIGATNQQMALMMTTIPGILGFLVGPAVSYKSDRSTHPWGRRKPYIIFTMPFLCLCLVSIGYTEEIAVFFQNSELMKQWGITPLAATITLVGLLVLGFQFFNEFVNSVWWYMFRDVVPEAYFGRFTGLSRVVGALGGFFWSLYVFPHAETNAKEIYLWITLLYFFGFSLMLWRVKEERHQPSEEEAAKLKPSIIGQARNYVRECFGHPIYVWGYIGVVFDYFGNGLGFVGILFAKQLGITLEQIGVFGAFMGIAHLVATYPAGMFADKFHPIRLCLITGTVTLVTPLLGYVFYQDWPSYVLLGLLWFPVTQIGQAAGQVLMMRVYPKKRYGQFASCSGMIRGLSKMGGAILGAYILDQLQDYRFYLLYNGALNIGTLICTFIVYYYWKKCGGDNYVAPLKEDK